jgi:hypothetical protein
MTEKLHAHVHLSPRAPSWLRDMLEKIFASDDDHEATVMDLTGRPDDRPPSKS